jgi:two-component system response regulator AtoC
VALPLLHVAAVGEPTFQNQEPRPFHPNAGSAANGEPQVMVVAGDPSMCDFLRSFLTARGYQAITLVDAEEAVKRYQAERPAAVILDVVMPGAMDGIEALAAFKRIDREVPVIAMSGHGGTTTVVQAMKLGASDVVSKPFAESDLEVPLANALKQRRLSREVASLCEQLKTQSTYNMLFDHSEQMAELQDLIERVADTDVTVLIRGESGTGKELVARALHASSLRRDKRFVKVNCAALPAELLESELFGFERGAFTGAIQQKAGKFEFANHGTMFLDEIGEMSPALQAKLLQVLQDGEFSRLGGRHDVHVDVRIIAATNRDLERAVNDGQFREDLFFRLNVVTLHIPALRDRRDQIPELADYFLKKYSVQYNKPFHELSPETLTTFMHYEWPGNVRELENLIKRVVVLGSETSVRDDLVHLIAQAAHHRPGAPAPARRAPAAAVEASDAATRSLKDISRSAARVVERELILKMLQQTRWNRKETAGNLGISYKALLYKIKENGLD